MEVQLGLLIDEVEGRVAPDTPPLERLATASAVAGRFSELSDALVDHYVDLCRRAGCSWAEIGGSLGVTKQAVQKRFTPRTLEEPLGWGRYTPRARRVVAEHAPGAARALGHGWVGTEHVLLGLYDEAEGLAAVTLVRLGAPRDAVVAAVEARLPRGEAPGGPFTPNAWAAVEGATRQALGLGHNYVGTEHQLLALLAGDTKGVAPDVLAELGVDHDGARAVVVELLSGYVGKVPGAYT